MNINRKVVIIITIIVIPIIISGVSIAVGLKTQEAKANKSAVAKFLKKIDKVTAHRRAGDQAARVCQACHRSMTSKKTPWHRLHLKTSVTKLSCPDCHKQVEVGPRSMSGKVSIDRGICLKCHRDKFYAYSESHLKRDWIAVHRQLRTEISGGTNIPSMEELQENNPNCFVCHQKKELNFCKDCHSYHPHGIDWINGKHGRRAVKTNFECLRCHDKNTWCSTQCHEGITLPHNIPKWSQFWQDEPEAPQWRQVHYKVAGEKGDKVCRRCHDSANSEGVNPDFCMQCHHKQFYQEFPDELGTPWINYAMKFVKNNGSSGCWQCHLPDFCVACHLTGSKPPPGTTFVGSSR